MRKDERGHSMVEMALVLPSVNINLSGLLTWADSSIPMHIYRWRHKKPFDLVDLIKGSRYHRFCISICTTWRSNEIANGILLQTIQDVILETM